MKDLIEISLVEDYFNKVNKEIDWEEMNYSDLIPMAQANLLQNILTTEVSIYLLRRNIGFCGSLVDDMVGIRRNFINQYEENFGEKYIEYNDFY